MTGMVRATHSHKMSQWNCIVSFRRTWFTIYRARKLFFWKKKKAKRNEDPKPGYNTLLDIYALFARLVEFEMLWFYFAAKYLCVNCFFGRSILNGNNTNFLHFFAAFWCAEWLKRLWWWCNARACAFVLISKWLTIVGIFGNIFL